LAEWHTGGGANHPWGPAARSRIEAAFSEQRFREELAGRLRDAVREVRSKTQGGR
jgi:hypothetical protein